MSRNSEVPFPSTLRVALLGALFVLTSSCSVVGPSPSTAPATPPELDGPSLEAGSPDEETNAAAARLLVESREALSAGSPERALELASEVRSRYPTATGSARVLLIEATAHRDMEAWEAGLEAAEDYLGVAADASAPETIEARVLVAELRLGGDLGGGVEALFELPREEPLPEGLGDRALEQARTFARTIDEQLLRQILDGAPPHPWLLPVFQAELAERRALVGDLVGAEELVQQARALAPADEERERLRRVEAGEVEPRGEVVGVLSAILSLDGSPTLSSLSEQIRDGIEVALLSDEVRGGIQLDAREDGGIATAASRMLTEIEDARPIGVIGPVSPAGFREVAAAASGDVPVISPTSPVPQGAPAGVFALTGPDPEAARALADLALSQGYDAVAVLHPESPGGRQEFEWFRTRYQEGGGRVSVPIAYPAGTNDFRPHFSPIVENPPQAIVVLATPDELPLLAAQLPFLGENPEDEDSRALELPILGNSTWASDQILTELPQSRTDGVLSVAPHTGEGYGPLWGEFVSAYEEHFQRTLRDPVPALGFDAARLLIEAARRAGTSSPEEVLAGLQALDAVPGATGTFSVQNGRIVRAYLPVRLEGGARIPLDD